MEQIEGFLEEGDYTLPRGTGVWITVGTKSVRIRHVEPVMVNDEELSPARLCLAVYELGEEMGDPLGEEEIEL